MTEQETTLEVVRMLVGLGLTVESVDSDGKRIVVSIPPPKN